MKKENLFVWVLLIAVAASCSGIPKVNADTFISGPIVAETTWEPSGNPYVITDTVYIESNTTLTVMPGTIVLSSGPGLFVYGTIEANGAIFTSSRDPGDGNQTGTPMIGDWSGISFRKFGGGTIQNCTIRYAQLGVECHAAHYYNDNDLPYINSVVAPIIQNNTITLCGQGLRVTASGHEFTDESYTATASPSIIGNTISEWSDAGIYVLGLDPLSIANPEVSGNIFQHSDPQIKKAIHIDLDGNPQHIEANTFDPDSHLCISYGGNDTLENRTLTPIANAYYLIEVSTGVGQGTLTITQGTVVLFGIRAELQVAGDASLQADGAVFTSVLDPEYSTRIDPPDEADYWWGITIYGSNSTISDCTIKYAGAGVQCLAATFQGDTRSEVVVNPNIINNTITNCSAGIRVSAEGSSTTSAQCSPQIYGNTIEDWHQYGLYILAMYDDYSIARPAVTNNTFRCAVSDEDQINTALQLAHNGWWVPSSNTFDSNSRLGAYLAGTVTRDRFLSPIDGVPYNRCFSVGADATLTINEGTVFLWYPGEFMEVRGTLNANGAIFTSMNDSDHGLIPGPPSEEDYWSGILFKDFGTGIIQNCDIRYSGTGISFSAEWHGVGGQIVGAHTSPHIIETQISNCHTGIYVYAAGANDEATATASPWIGGVDIYECQTGIHLYQPADEFSTVSPEIFDCIIAGNETGIYAIGHPLPTVSYCSISGNSQHGLNFDSWDGVSQINCRFNWWGDPSGPQADSNLTGQGDSVIGNVDFDPWAESPPTSLLFEIVQEEPPTNFIFPPQSGDLVSWLNRPVDPSLPTVVITHGWNPLGMESETPDWIIDMANAIDQRAIVPLNILWWNWLEQASSALPIGNQSAGSNAPSQGNFLADALYSTLSGTYNQNVHFIGHSMGARVNKQAVDDLTSGANNIAWDGSNIHVTILDTPELYIVESDVLSRSMPENAFWIDNYISAFGNCDFGEADNVILRQNMPIDISPSIQDIISEMKDFHGYPCEWYTKTIRSPDQSLMGFGRSYEGSGQIQSSTGGVYIQSLDSNQELNVEQQTWSDAQTIVFARNSLFVMEASLLVVDLIETAASPIRISGVVTGIVQTVIVDGVFKRIFKLSLAESSPAYAWIPLTIPEGVEYISFDYELIGSSDDDILSVGIDDESLFLMETQYIEPNVAHSSGLIDIHAYAGHSAELFFGLIDGGEVNGNISITNIRFHSSIPPDRDTDGDGIPDYFELRYGLDIEDPSDADLDIDLPQVDGLTNLQEFQAGTNPNVYDSDNDGFGDGDEVGAGSNPLNPESYISTTIRLLHQGFNLVAIPAEFLGNDDLRDWLDTFGTGTEIDRVMAYDRGQGTFVTLVPGAVDNPAFTLQPGLAVYVYALQSKEVTFDSLLSAPIDLQPGMNLVGFSDPPVDCSAFDVLTVIGSENVSSIQRFTPTTGTFETAAYDFYGQIGGSDFPIINGEGYIIHMQQAVAGFQLP